MLLGEWSRAAATQLRPWSIPSQKDLATVDRMRDTYSSSGTGNGHALCAVPMQPELVECSPELNTRCLGKQLFLASLTLLRSLILLYIRTRVLKRWPADNSLVLNYRYSTNASMFLDEFSI